MCSNQTSLIVASDLTTSSLGNTVRDYVRQPVAYVFPCAQPQIRMELSHLRALLDGMELSNYRTMQDDHDAMKKKLASVTLELQACREKLAVYMR